MTTSSPSRAFSFDLDQTRPKKRPGPPLPPRVPRLARLLALALELEGLVRDGTIRDYATLARLGHVSRARMSQVMNLLVLAPDIQEEILFLPSTPQRPRCHHAIATFSRSLGCPPGPNNAACGITSSRQLVRNRASSGASDASLASKRKPKVFVSPNDHPG